MPLSLEEILRNDKLTPAEESMLPETVHWELPHLPVVLLVDTSDSMNKPESAPPIKEVSKKLGDFFGRVRAANSEFYRKLQRQGDFCVVRYGGAEATVEMPWTNGTELPSNLSLAASGTTPMGRAIVVAGNMLLERYRGYKASGTLAFCGFVFNLTDGRPTDMNPIDESEGRKAKWQEAKAMVTLFETMGSAKHPYAQFIHFTTDADSLELLRNFAGSADLYAFGGEEAASTVQRVNMLDGEEPFDRFIKYIEISLKGL